VATGFSPSKGEGLKPVTTFRRLIAGAWFGAGLFILIASTAIFRIGGPDTVGAVLTRWHYIALLAPFALVFFEWRKQRGRVVLLLFLAITIAAFESFLDVRIAAIRRESPVPISALSRDNPVRRRFGMMHGISVLLLMLDVAAAAGVIAADRDN
jgi:hypothetical protein